MRLGGFKNLVYFGKKMTVFAESPLQIYFTNETEILKVNKVKRVFPLILYDWLLITLSFRDPLLKLTDTLLLCNGVCVSRGVLTLYGYPKCFQ